MTTHMDFKTYFNHYLDDCVTIHKRRSIRIVFKNDWDYIKKYLSKYEKLGLIRILTDIEFADDNDDCVELLHVFDGPDMFDYPTSFSKLSEKERQIRIYEIVVWELNRHYDYVYMRYPDDVVKKDMNSDGSVNITIENTDSFPNKYKEYIDDILVDLESDGYLKLLKNPFKIKSKDEIFAIMYKKIPIKYLNAIDDEED